MYSLKAILEKEPAAIAEGIRVILLTLVAVGVFTLGEQNLAVITIAISVLLSLFVRSASTSKSAPTLDVGTSVSVAGSPDKVIIATSPPGPVGVEGAGEGPA